MKIKCRRCDLCGREMGGKDFLQYWIKKPRIRFGYPSVEMKNYDICGPCFSELSFLVKRRTKKEETK